MKTSDRFLQRWRIRRASKFIPKGARLLDIGCHQGEIFHLLARLEIRGIGIDPLAEITIRSDRFSVIRGWFPGDLPALEQPFDVITALAVVEHIPAEQTSEFARACASLLMPGGRLIVTVPSPQVDRILAVLTAIRIADGMSLEQHQGFEPAQVEGIFKPAGIELEHHEKFQFGLNNLFVFTNVVSPDHGHSRAPRLALNRR